MIQYCQINCVNFSAHVVFQSHIDREFHQGMKQGLPSVVNIMDKLVETRINNSFSCKIPRCGCSRLRSSPQCIPPLRDGVVAQKSEAQLWEMPVIKSFCPRLFRATGSRKNLLRPAWRVDPTASPLTQSVGLCVQGILSPNHWKLLSLAASRYSL